MQVHGDIESLGFRIGNVAYCTDVSAFPDESLKYIRHADVLIIGALQYRPHPSHFSLEQALEWIEFFGPKRAILTHMHVPLDYDTVMQDTPDHVEPGYDGLRFEVPL
jgi:phosphoribosyl 1,2-cyclic phosphate phosphodiesterase